TLSRSPGRSRPRRRAGRTCCSSSCPGPRRRRRSLSAASQLALPSRTSSAAVLTLRLDRSSYVVAEPDGPAAAMGDSLARGHVDQPFGAVCLLLQQRGLERGASDRAQVPSERERVDLQLVCHRSHLLLVTNSKSGRAQSSRCPKPNTPNAAVLPYTPH